jgi:hypothetical protein
VEPGLASALGQPVFVGGNPNQGDFFSIQSTDGKGGTCPEAPSGAPFVDHWGTACVVPTNLVVPTLSWSLICFANDGASTQTFFVNGTSVSVAGSNYDYPLDTIMVGTNEIIGTTTNATFYGTIDEVTIWEHALLPSELATLWNAGFGCAPVSD